MPFTFAHPALVLPFARVRQRYLSLTALVIGSMVPDAEYFIRMKVDSRYFHTAAGLFYFDLPVGLLLYWMYGFFLRMPLIIHLPAWLKNRFAPIPTDRTLYRSVSGWVIISVSILIGAVSHLLWDSFTHFRGYFVRRLGPLRSEIIAGDFQIHIFELLQHGGTTLGLLSIAWVIYKLPSANGTITPPPFRYYWLIVADVAVVVFFSRYLFSKPLIFEDVVISGISALLLGLLCASVVYLLQQSRSSTAES